MTRISISSTRETISSTPHFLSNFQLCLDASSSQLSAQTGDASLIASMTLAGIVGQVARLGFLSSGAGALLSQIGSVGIEAASLTGIEHFTNPHSPSFFQSTANNTINVGVFRLFAPLRFANAALQQGVQATALVTAQNAAALFGITESSQQSLAEQFAGAFVTNLRLHGASGLGHFLTGGNLLRVQHQFEANSSMSPLANLSTARDFLPSMAAQKSPGSRQRSGTDIVDRVSRPAEAIVIENPQASLDQLHEFSSKLDSVLNLLSRFVEHTEVGAIKIKDIYLQHRNLIPENAGWKGYFRNRLDEFGRAIKACEAPAQISQEPTVSPEANPPTENPISSGHFGWIGSAITFLLNLRPFGKSNPALPLPSPSPAPRVSMAAREIQTHREAYVRLYDQLVLLQEALRIVRNDHPNPPESDRALLSQMESAYEGLHENLQARRDHLRRSTTRVMQLDMQQFVDQWGEAFLKGVRNLRVARNLQTLLARVFLVQGEHIGGSFYGAFHEATRNERAHIFLSVYYDHHTAQIVAFDDGSATAKKTISNYRAAQRGLTRVHYVVDREESGRIIDVEFNDPAMAEANRAIIRGLIGLQVAPENYIFGYTDLNPQSAQKFIISNRISREDPSGSHYDVLAIAQPDGRNQSLVTLRQHSMPESSNVQLWVSNNQAKRLPDKNNVVRILRHS